MHVYTCVSVNMLYVKFWTFISEVSDWKWEFHLIYCHMVFACIYIIRGIGENEKNIDQVQSIPLKDFKEKQYFYMAVI